MFPTAHNSPRPRGPAARGKRPAFTLLEALVATVVMSLSVTAVAMALGSGRQHSLEAKDQLQAGLAAEALMAEILAADYAAIAGYDDHDEPPGSMVTFDDVAYPESFYRIGRRAVVVETMVMVGGLGAKIKGMDIAVEAYDVDGRVLLTLSRFVPEPAP